MLHLFFSQLLFLSVVLPQVSLFLWSDFFFGLITVGFVVEKSWGGSQGSHYFVYWLWSPFVLLPPDPSSFCVALLIFLTCMCIGMYKDASICMYVYEQTQWHTYRYMWRAKETVSC